MAFRFINYNTYMVANSVGMYNVGLTFHIRIQNSKDSRNSYDNALFYKIIMAAFNFEFYYR